MTLEDSKHEIFIPLKDSEDVNGIIKNVIMASNKLGFEKKVVRQVTIKKIFGDGIRITMEIDNKWFKII